ncbi:MAG: 50S ribosomal protein L23 [Syntrophomonadaceae bacterium]|jgi:large subunit ribosomal protein L23|nr:50S ribosomal protein L23 [Syntrophomonadaceae bacterium]
MKDLRDVIIRPLVTEKSMNLLEENKYTFIVGKRSNKTEIKNAIEKIFKVNVEKVSTMNVKGKPKKMGRFIGKKPDYKKAIVKVRSGEKIRIFDNV